MVFMGDSMGADNRTPEDDQKLGMLEEKLVELKLVSTPKLEILCSNSYLHRFNEPSHIGSRPPPRSLSAQKKSSSWSNTGGVRNKQEERRKNDVSAMIHFVRGAP